LILILIVIPFFYPKFLKQKEISHAEFENELAKLNIEKTDSAKSFTKNYKDDLSDDYSSNDRKKYEPVKAEVFYFDPNTATSADWTRLGLRDKTIQTIHNYLSKGGKFYKPADIGKIWGMTPADVQRLMPYVSIKSDHPENSDFAKKAYANTSTAYAPKSYQPIDINLADTSEFISLPGIGSKLSNRIIAFRDKLGGFYSVDQVGETFLLPDSTFQKIKPRLVINNSKVKQININNASVDEMKTHPYLRYNLANAIAQYRQQHGSFNSIDEIKKIMLITEDVFAKIAPYLSVQ